MTATESKIIVRNTTKEDIDELVPMAVKGYGYEDMAPTKEKYESHIDHFPEGQFCVEYDGKLIASCSSVLINIEDYGENHTFDEVAGGGYIRNHNPNGKNLYGIDVVVDPDYRGMQIGKRLYEARRKLAKDLNLESIIFGGRIPNYEKYADQMSAEEYVSKVLEGDIYDPVIVFQTRNGFVCEGVMKDYIPKDKESLGYAALMVWKNPDYVPPAN
ncbi:GNAT family N-acetyltransferase [Siminovitchia sediminis]|uniref:GNAT family N-acetyltransferase n=1 Tax=Siminovitchia sediminis TaxID=1274353 RepID=A0ABW4KF21_9BACI